MMLWANMTREERIEAIRPHWDAGLSAKQISELFVGCTKNAVVGYVFREGLRKPDQAERTLKAKRNAKRADKSAHYKRHNNLVAVNLTRKPKLIIGGNGSVHEKPEGQKPRAIAKAQAFEPLPGSNPKPWLERAFNECAWPVGGEGADTLSCCEPCEGTYCNQHYELRLGKGTPSEREAHRVLEKAA